MQDAPLIKVIKPGTFTSVEGTQISFSLADLASAAAVYDPESDPAPLVIGHPTIDAPAYGWVRSLTVTDGHLVAEPDPDRLEPAFAEAVRAGRYRKVSGRFYQPNSPNNPKPGSFYLQHVGFLGAAAPAVKGLGTVNFAEAGADVVTIDQPGGTASIQEKNMDPNVQTAAFAEREAELTRQQSDLDSREAAIAAREASALKVQHASNVSFAETLVSAGKLAPVGKDLVVGLLDRLGGAAPDTVSFGEGNAELAPDAALRKLLDGTQPLVSFGEKAAPEAGEEKPVEPQAIADRAVAFAEEQRTLGNNITIAAAVRHVEREAKGQS